jgi:hypothetical protein
MKKLILASALGLALLSCKKDDAKPATTTGTTTPETGITTPGTGTTTPGTGTTTPGTGTAKTPKELIVGDWIQESGYAIDADGIKEVYTLKACEKDDVTSFLADSKFIVDEGASKCDPEDDQRVLGEYTLSDDGKTLIMTAQDFPIPIGFKIVELTATKLTYEFTFGEEKESLTFKRK